jgi:hypothetical protein
MLALSTAAPWSMGVLACSESITFSTLSVHLGSVSVQRHRDPRAHRRGRLTDRLRGHLDHDGRDVAVLEVVRAAVKQVRCEFSRGKCGAVRVNTCPVRSEQIRGQASEDPHTRVARGDPAGSTRSDDLALRALRGIPAGGPAHLQSLYVPPLGTLASGMPNLTEANLECHFLVSVIVDVET